MMSASRSGSPSLGPMSRAPTTITETMSASFAVTHGDRNTPHFDVTPSTTPVRIDSTLSGTPPDWTPFPGEHFHVHGAIPHGNRSYVALVDAGMAIVDISDVGKPKTISRLDWSPPYGGYAHTTLPLPGRKLVVAVTSR